MRNRFVPCCRGHNFHPFLLENSIRSKYWPQFSAENPEEPNSASFGRRLRLMEHPAVFPLSYRRNVQIPCIDPDASPLVRPGLDKCIYPLVFKRINFETRTGRMFTSPRRRRSWHRSVFNNALAMPAALSPRREGRRKSLL